MTVESAWGKKRKINENPGNRKTPAHVIRGCNVQEVYFMDAYITIDTLYLHLKYPRGMFSDNWYEPVKYLDTRVLKNGCVVDNLVVKTGASGYKISIWNHDAQNLF